MGIKNVSPLHPLSDFRTATVPCAHPNQKGEQWLRLWCKTKGQLVYDERVSCRHFPGSPVVKTLPSNTWCVGSIPGQGAKILHALWLKNEKMKQKQYCIKFNKGSKKKKMREGCNNEGTCEKLRINYENQCVFPSTSLWLFFSLVWKGTNQYIFYTFPSEFMYSSFYYY